MATEAKRQLLEYCEAHKIGSPGQIRSLRAVIDAGSTRKGAQAVKKHHATVDKDVRRLFQLAEASGFGAIVATGPTEEKSIEVSDDAAEIKIRSTTQLDESAIVSEAGLDADIWRIKSHRKWTTAMKLSDDTVVSVWNYHYIFERKIALAQVDAIRDILANWRPAKATRAVSGAKDGVLVEIDHSDVHFGKLCYQAVRGEDYDTEAEAGRFVDANTRLLERLDGERVERFLVPIGNDFFQADSWALTTTKGTRVSSKECQAQVFVTGFTAFEASISHMLEIAPVELVWVPGNHDANVSWHLYFALSKRFETTKHLTAKIDLWPRRQYYEWGHSVVAFQHGEKMKPIKMAQVAATEFPNWSRKRFREIHCGHRHTRYETEFTGVSEYSGVMVRYLHALSCDDLWHYEQGFVGNRKASQAFIWDKEEGPRTEHFTFIE